MSEGEEANFGADSRGSTESGRSGRKPMPTWAKWTIGIAAVVIIGAMLPSADEGPAASSSPASLSTNSQRDVPTSCVGSEYCLVFEVGRTEVSRVRCLSAYSCASDGKVFVYFSPVVVTNRGEKNVDISPFNFKFYTSGGVYTYTWQTPDAMNSKELRPGGSASGNLAFEVDEREQEERLCFEGYGESVWAGKQQFCLNITGA